MVAAKATRLHGMSKEQLAKERANAERRGDAYPHFIPSTDIEYDRDEGRRKILKLRKQPREAPGLPFKKSIKDYTIMLVKVKNPVFENQLLFEVRKFYQNTLVFRTQHRNFDDANRAFKSTVSQTYKLVKKQRVKK
jgi:hypothetical protein